MRAPDVRDLYDDEYATAYEEQFLHVPSYQHISAYELHLLELLLKASENWLDIGCGTGYFLSHFPGVARGGLDLSADMLERARARNPDALFLEQGDFRERREAWDGAWDLVSCMWCAYAYADSMAEIDRVVGNMARWTSDDGVCFLPLCDIEDVLMQREGLPYHTPDIDLFGGSMYTEAIVWTWVDPLHQKTHKSLIAPHIGYLVDQFKKTFSTVEVAYYPPYPLPLTGQRKALVAAGKGGAPAPRTEAVLQAIREESRAYRAEAQANRRAAARESAYGAGRAGWLRRCWNALPERVQHAVLRAIGEA